jgi:hypothetical protein
VKGFGDIELTPIQSAAATFCSMELSASVAQ